MAVEKRWNFAKTPANFKLYDDFDDGDLVGWDATACSIETETPDGTGYSVLIGNGVGFGSLEREEIWSAYDDLHLSITFKLLSNKEMGISIDGPSNTLNYRIGTAPTGGDINIAVVVGVWYTIVLPVSKDFYDTKGVQLAFNYIAISSFDQEAQMYMDWIGFFRASAFSDDYCISCTAGFANDVDSVIRDTDNDDVYLETTNSDLQITDDTDIGSVNCKLTIYYTLGELMKLKVTISWEISETPQTDYVFYIDSGVSWAINLPTVCPDIDKVTNIKIENVLA